jgi:diaminopimelate decarboxylase
MAESTFTYRKKRGTDELFCEEVAVSELLRQYGSPLWVYSKQQLLTNLAAMRKGLEGATRKDHYVSYAVKANANPAILRLLSGEGAGASIVSGGELVIARSFGFPKEKITFDGPGKSDYEIRHALEEGIAAFNVESLQEITVIDAIAASLGTRARISVRVNPDVDAKTHPYISTGMSEHKFGIDITEAREAYRYAASKEHIDIVGVHVHIGSHIPELDPFVKAAESVAAFVRTLQDDGINIQHINTGGGQSTHYRNVLQHASLPRDPYDSEYEPESLPTLDAYVQAVVAILEPLGAKLIFEPGRAIVGNICALVGTVLYTKKNPKKNFVIADIGMTDLIRPSFYGSYHQIVPTRLTTSETQTVDIVGPVCESSDFVAEGRQFPLVERGDGIAILCTGAYGYVMSSNYNMRMRAAEVLVDGDTHRLIRNRETVEDITRTFVK